MVMVAAVVLVRPPSEVGTPSSNVDPSPFVVVGILEVEIAFDLLPYVDRRWLLAI